MGDLNHLEALGREVARQQDSTLLGPRGYANVRASLLEAPRERRRRGVLALSFATAALGAALALWLWFGRGQLVLRHAGSELSGAVSTRIEAGQTQERLSFSDGSELVLEPTSRLRVARVESQVVELELERGRMRAVVESAGRTRWRITSGPVEVVVTGTRFDVSWDGERRRFALDVTEGKVRVSARGAGSERTVAAGESYVIDCQADPAACGSRVEELAPPVASRQNAPLPTPTAESPAPSASAPAPPSWKTLVRQGKYKLALDAVGDFEAACRAAGPDELMELANLARLAGAPAKAMTAFTLSRSRFPGHPRAAEAAFQLGRMAFDGRGNYGEAARWFSTYLGEQPGGPFARDALGRLLECHQRSGATSAAQATAKRYLAAYPNGPHAPLARSLAGED